MMITSAISQAISSVKTQRDPLIRYDMVLVMVDEKKYFDELQKIIGQTKSADRINERWNEVLNRLDELSIEYARELGQETGTTYDKPDGKGTIQNFGLDEFPPGRLLALTLILARWVGWHSIPKGMQTHPLSAFHLIQNAFTNGVNDYVEYRKTEVAK